VDIDKFYTGVVVLETEPEIIDRIYKEGMVNIEGYVFEPNQNVTLIERFRGMKVF
jgi:hypothetical protein